MLGPDQNAGEDTTMSEDPVEVDMLVDPQADSTMGEESLTWRDKLHDYYQGCGKDDFRKEDLQVLGLKDTKEQGRRSISLAESKILPKFLAQCRAFGAESVDEKLTVDVGCMDHLDQFGPEKSAEVRVQVAELLSGKVTDRLQWMAKLDAVLHELSCDPESSDASGALDVEAPTAPEGRDAEDVEAQVKATISAWRQTYSGNIARHLWDYIRIKYQKRHSLRQYANLGPIIQSSGSGKSRAVDELATEHFVISICLRKEGSQGFPPPDFGVSAYLTTSMQVDDKLPEMEKRGIRNQRLNLFLTTLFNVTLKNVEELAADSNVATKSGLDKYRALARLFRDRMTDGTTMERTNAYRRTFFKSVIAQAKALDIGNVDASKTSRNAIVKLQDFLESILAPTTAVGLHPLIIIAFDESAVLTYPVDKYSPPVLNRLRSQLSPLVDISFFCLFLSTTGQISAFMSPAGLPEASNRVLYGELHYQSAFTGCAFDRFTRESLEGELTIQTVAGEDYMIHLGRPLWATRVDSPEDEKSRLNVQRSAIRFAMAKLLNVTTLGVFEKWTFDDIQTIACLCQRLPIDFHSTSYVYQKTLVENHMRLCLWADPVEEAMVTIAASEPVLAEAASIVMKHPACNIERALAMLMGTFSVDKGDRGEFLSLVFMLLARDGAVFGKNETDMWTSTLRDVKEKFNITTGETYLQLEEWDRVITVPEFINNLFSGLPTKFFEKIQNDFANGRMHFNHYIKTVTQATMGCQFLTRMLARGAALLCADCQQAVDMINPVLMGNILDRHAITYIMSQVKNDPKYGVTPQWKLLDVMDSVDLIVPKQVFPVIRIVFALASKRSGITTRIKTVENDDGSTFQAYDIWCAGIDPEFLKPIENRGVASRPYWAALVSQSQRWTYNYKLPGQKTPTEYLEEMTPCVAHEEPFWRFFPGLLGDETDET